LHGFKKLTVAIFDPRVVQGQIGILCGTNPPLFATQGQRCTAMQPGQYA